MNPPAKIAPVMTWRNCHHANDDSRTAGMFVSSTVPSRPSVYPTGCCIHALVTTMKYPDIHEQSQTTTAEAACSFGVSIFLPYRRPPRKTDSPKNAKTDSIARGWPITDPVRPENAAQFVPN